jgi:hypothetical protein
MIVMEGRAVLCTAAAEAEVEAEVETEVVVEVAERSRRICAVASEAAGSIVVEHVVVADTTAASRLETSYVVVAEHLLPASFSRSCSCDTGTQCSLLRRILVRQR